MDNRGKCGQLRAQEAAALAELDLVEDDAAPAEPDDESDEPDDEPDEPDDESDEPEEVPLLVPVFASDFESDVDSDLVLPSEPDSFAAAARLSVR